jgi:putative ABC transport system permease protein
MSLALKQAFRQLAKAPTFAVISTLMLALGIAMSTSTFSITNGALLRPLPFPQPDGLVRVFTVSRQSSTAPLAPGNAMELRDVLSDVGEFGIFHLAPENIAESGQPPEQQDGMAVSANFLRILGVQPALGRDFAPDESEPGKPPVILLTHRFWRDRFGADASVLGKVLRTGTENSIVIGVLPPSFDEPLVWRGCKFVRVMTLWHSSRTERANKWMDVVGRLKPGVSLSAAQPRLAAFAARIAHDYPTDVGTDGLRLTELGPSFADSHTRTLYWLVVGLSILVLGIACANLGGVQLTRGLARRGELSVRVALGATRRDLMVTLATESLLLVGGGTTLGILFTYWARDLLGRWVLGPPVSIDGRVLTFAACSGLLAVMAFGLLPAWFTTRSNLVDGLKASSPGGSSSASQHRLKFALTIGQMGLALVLVSSAASLVVGTRAFLHRDRGWQPEGLVSGTFSVPWRWVVREQKSPVLARIIEQKLGALPGVQVVAVASEVPLHGWQDKEPIFIEGADALPPGREPTALVTGVNQGFFDALRIDLREGRLLPREWRPNDPPIAVIGAATALHFWPRESAVGKRIRFGKNTAWHQIIGVVADARFDVKFDAPETPLQVYHPVQEDPVPWSNFILRTSLPAASLERSVRKEFSAIDPDMMIVEIADVPQMLAGYVKTPLIPILVAFAIAGLLIAMIGLYGVMTQLTLQRRREIGVRIALGANHRQVILMILGQGARLVVIGGVVGIAGACAVNAILRSALPTMPVLGWFLQSLVALALGLAGLAACYFPSRRAALVNPIEVLRAD